MSADLMEIETYTEHGLEGEPEMERELSGLRRTKPRTSESSVEMPPSLGMTGGVDKARRV